MSDFDDEFRIAEKRIKDEQAELKRKKEAEAAAKAAEKAAEEKRCSIIRKKYENEMRRVFAVIEPKFRHCGYHAELENGDIQIFRSLKTLGNLVTNQKRILNGLYYRWDAELSTSVLYDGEAAVKVHISREAQVNDRSKNWDTNWAID